MDRSKLPFRKNCEGYFFDGKGNVLAEDTGLGFLRFPGGGVDEDEDVKKALIRETLEETGAIVKNVKKIGELKFVWSENWAKTERQKNRYKYYRGEDMQFFIGDIEKFEVLDRREEDFWKGDKLMPIEKAIEIIEAEDSSDEDIKEYRKMQLDSLKGPLSK